MFTPLTTPPRVPGSSPLLLENTEALWAAMFPVHEDRRGPAREVGREGDVGVGDRGSAPGAAGVLHTSGIVAVTVPMLSPLWHRVSLFTRMLTVTALDPSGAPPGARSSSG